MKKITAKIILTVLIGVAFTFTQCTHDDVSPTNSNPDPTPTEVERGSDEINEADGWNFDKTHSSIRWESAYLGSAALLTGRFNDFDIDIDFDEDNPENIQIAASVVLSSVNTGEPGRDAGCLLGTFGTDVSDEATFISSGVEFAPSGTGYIVTGNLTFHGVTSEVIVPFEYTGITNLPDTGRGASNVVGFAGEFVFNAKSVFGIESNNIADGVVVKINGQFRQPL